MGKGFLLDRTGILTVALLAGDIGQSGLGPGQENVLYSYRNVK